MGHKIAITTRYFNGPNCRYGSFCFKFPCSALLQNRDFKLKNGATMLVAKVSRLQNTEMNLHFLLCKIL